MSDEAARQSSHPFLVRTDELVIELRHHDPDAYLHIEAHGQPVELLLQAFNVIDTRDGELTGPGLDEMPIGTTTLALPAYGVSKFDLRGGGAHPLAPATQFNKVTTLQVVSGEINATIVCPTDFRDYIRQPASTPIET